MGFLDYFRRRNSQSASVAKDRLSIIVAREHGPSRGKLDYLPQLKQELLQVIARYEKIDLEQVTVNVEHNGNCDVLELNVILSEKERRASTEASEDAFFPEPKRMPSATTRPAGTMT